MRLAVHWCSRLVSAHLFTALGLGSAVLMAAAVFATAAAQAPYRPPLASAPTDVSPSTYPSDLAVNFNVPERAEVNAPTRVTAIVGSSLAVGEGLAGAAPTFGGPGRARFVRLVLTAGPTAVVAPAGPDCQAITDDRRVSWSWSVTPRTASMLPLQFNLSEAESCAGPPIAHRVDRFWLAAGSPATSFLGEGQAAPRLERSPAAEASIGGRPSALAHLLPPSGAHATSHPSDTSPAPPAPDAAASAAGSASASNVAAPERPPGAPAPAALSGSAPSPPSPSPAATPATPSLPLPGLEVAYNAPDRAPLYQPSRFTLIIASAHPVTAGDFRDAPGPIQRHRIPKVALVRAVLSGPSSDQVLIEKASGYECQEVTQGDNPRWDWFVTPRTTAPLPLQVDLWEVSDCSAPAATAHHIDSFHLQVTATAGALVRYYAQQANVVIGAVLALIAAAGAAFGAWKWLPGRRAKPMVNSGGAG